MSDDFSKKVPPHDLEAEQATLGALMLDWTAFPEVYAMGLRPEDFYAVQNQRIYAAMLDMDSRGGVTPDTLSIVEELRSSGHLEAVGGAGYVASLTDLVPTSANILHYAKTVFEFSLRRQLLKLSATISSDVFDNTVEVRSAIENAQSAVFNLAERKTIKGDVVFSLKEMATNLSNLIEHRQQHSGEFTGIPTGFTKLDTMTNGFQKSDYIIIGARPSMGKTAIALNMATHMALKENKKVAFFSLEMSALQLGIRLVSSEMRIPNSKFNSGLLSSSEFLATINTLSKLYDYSENFYFVDTPDIRMLDLRTHARRLRALHDIDIIFIDYLGRIKSEHPNMERYNQYTEISGSLKSLARELQIPIVVLSQVGRQAEKEKKEPSLADLRETGAIEQDADIVMFVHRERAKDEDTDAIESNLIVAKHRNGPVGTIKLTFMSKYTRFENMADE